jgi:hypothetical protein
MRRFRRHLLTLVPLALALAVPASAGAATFGADLSGPVTPANSCGAAYGRACLISSSSTTTGFYAPFSGIVNTVRIKTADIAQGDGQAQIVVMRSYYQNNPNSPGHPNFFCCFVQSYGPTVTLQRNAVNVFNNTNIGMVEDPTPGPNDFNTVAKDDFLSLNLSSTLPGPLGQEPGGFVDVTDRATEPAPATNPHGNLIDRLSGYKVMMNADVDPISGGGGGGGGGGANPGGAGAGGGNAQPPQQPPARPANPVTFGGGNFNGGNATIPIACALDATCAGLVQLLNQAQFRVAGAAKKAKKPKRPTVYGSGSFSIPAHQTGQVKVKLTAAGKKLLKKRKSVTLFAKATVGAQVTTTRVTLTKKK